MKGKVEKMKMGEDKNYLYQVRLAVSLVISRMDTNGQGVGHPYQISRYEDFVGRPFDDLREYMENITAPRIKRDRYGDNLKGSHIM